MVTLLRTSPASRHLACWDRQGSLHTASLYVLRRTVASFLGEGEDPYDDSPQRIHSSGATISAPHMHAACLQLLAPHMQPGAQVGVHACLCSHVGLSCCMLWRHRWVLLQVLDVGSGSGYLTAVFAVMVHGGQTPERPQGGTATGQPSTSDQQGCSQLSVWLSIQYRH